MSDSPVNEADVIIIGGGATRCRMAPGLYPARPAPLLLERFDIATGATGRNHGLHSGACYAVTDPESAGVYFGKPDPAAHCPPLCRETDGLFITLPEDDMAYQATLVKPAAQQVLILR